MGGGREAGLDNFLGYFAESVDEDSHLEGAGCGVVRSVLAICRFSLTTHTLSLS